MNSRPFAAFAFQNLYNLLGRATGLLCGVERSVGDSGVISWVHTVGLQLDSRRWQWNDFVVTTDSQMFAGRRAVGSSWPAPLPSLNAPGQMTSPSTGISGRNHSSVADETTANAVLESIRGLR